MFHNKAYISVIDRHLRAVSGIVW